MMRFRSKKGISPIPSIVVLTILVGTFYCWYILHDKTVQAQKKFEDLKLAKAKKISTMLNEISERKIRLETLQNLCGVGFEKEDKIFDAVFINDDKLEEKGTVDVPVKLSIPAALKWLERINASAPVKRPKLPTIDDVYTTPNRDATIQNYILSFQKRIKALEDEIQSNREKLKQKEDQLKTARSQKQTELDSRKQKIERKLQEKLNAEKTLRDEVAALTDDRDSARKEKNEEKQSLNTIKAQFRIEKTDLETQLEDVLARVEKIKNPEEDNFFEKKIENPPDSPDGQIVYVDFPNKIAYINLGLQSGVSVGQKFSVFRFGKRGVRTEKGEIEVKKVTEELSLVAITQNLDEEYPIAPGDQIMNEVFDVTKTQYFAFAGRLVGRYSNEEVTQMIEEIGWKVTPKTDVRTSFIIIGKDFENHPNFIDGLKYDIETLREVDILRILGKHEK